VDGRGLPGAVGTEEAVDLARSDTEVDAVDSADAAFELSDEALDLDATLLGCASVGRAHIRSIIA
jgi:hypothetical protein